MADSQPCTPAEFFGRGHPTKKILVTDGNIGSHVAEGLAQKGLPVRLLAKAPRANPNWDQLGIEQVAGDLADIDSLAPAFDGVDRFFCVTPFVENLVQLGTNAVEAARRAGVRYIVRSSLMRASETSITLRREHREVEKAVEASGIPFTILQPNTFMQSLLMNADSINSANALFMPQGDGAEAWLTFATSRPSPSHVSPKPGMKAGHTLSLARWRSQITR